MTMNDKTYDVLKWIAMIVLPAVATLYFTLASHSAKINDIVYYRTATNCDYLISSSDDTAIKIWNITQLHLYLSKEYSVQSQSFYCF